MYKRRWLIFYISLWVICAILIIWALQGCGGSTLTGNIIKPNTQIQDVKVSCMQEGLINQNVFKYTFKYDDSYPPTIYVYITGEWNKLDDKNQESTLYDIGRIWHACNPDNLAVLTVLAYDINDMAIMAVFVSKGD